MSELLKINKCHPITSILLIKPTRNLKLAKVLGNANNETTTELLLNTDDYNAFIINLLSAANRQHLSSYEVSKIIYAAELNPFYWHNIKTTVDATLLGYHGMLIFLQSSQLDLSKSNITCDILIRKSIQHIITCIQQSKCSLTKRFKVLFSHYTLSYNESKLTDLCQGLEAVSYLYRDFAECKESIIKIQLTSENDLDYFINRNRLEFIKQIDPHNDDTSQVPLSPLTHYGYHEFICITVGFIGLTEKFAPISGELTFANLTHAYLTDHFTSGLKTIDSGLSSAQTLNAQSDKDTMANEVVLKSLLEFMKMKVKAKKQALSLTEDAFLSEKTKTGLCQLMKDSLGGNSCTSLILFLPDRISLYGNEDNINNQCTQLLSIASIGRLVYNYPDKRIFAERALVDIYLQELNRERHDTTTDTATHPTNVRYLIWL